MIIPELEVRKYLQTVSALTALTEERIYEVRLPIKKFINVQIIPQTILIQSAGGTVQRGAPIIYPDLLFKCYGPTIPDAYALYQVLFDELDEHENIDITAPNRILEAYCSVLGQPTLDQQTDWEYIMATFSFIMTNQ